MAAKDYSGCIQSNSGHSPGISGPTKDSVSILGREKCFDNCACIAQSGQDQLGLAKVVGWSFVIIEKLARQKEHVPPLIAVGTWLMLAPAAIASKKIFQDKLVRHLLVHKSGLPGLW